ncbi:MAG: DUF5313 family protein [bacterium]
MSDRGPRFSGRPSDRDVGAAKRGGQRRRPTVWQWIRYSCGAGLPPSLSQWVLHDTTGPTWWLRHLSRSILQMAPLVAAVILFLPGPIDLRLYTALLGFLTGLMCSVFFMWGITEHRLVKAGFAPGVAEQAREERVSAHRRLQ